ncbi:MAG: GIY-YIG nuclease family protein [Candidatus Zixiibacteriota bacterium]
MSNYYVYILASGFKGTIYIGMTDNLNKRIYEHKNDLIDGFTKKYRVHDLVYYEVFENAYSAIAREKQSGAPFLRSFLRQYLRQGLRHGPWPTRTRILPY